MTNKNFYILLLLLNFIYLCAQETNKTKVIQGYIIDSIGKPIENVIVLLESRQGQIIAYSQTDSIGTYILKYKSTSDEFIFKARRIGFKTFNQNITQKFSEFNVIMQISPDNNLREVVIRNKRPIETVGDTVSYNPSYFKDGTEKNVEELLAKLPGISVDVSTGVIKYQGQEIKKILLDGDDLTGSNYKILSKNLSAEWLDDVEIIKKFNDKRLLRGIKKSDDIALNLKLNENAKAPIFGKINIGGGIASKYAIKTELLSYQKKIKIFSIAETNNIGSDLETYDFDTYLNSQEAHRNLLTSSKLLNNSLEPPDFLKAENFKFQHGFFSSSALVYKPSDKLRIKSLTTFYDNNMNYIFTDSISYFLPNNLNLSVNEFQNQVQRPQEFFEDLKIDYTLKDNQDLNLLVQYKNIRSNVNSKNATIFRDVSQTDIQNQDKLFSKLTYTNKINEKWVLETELKLALDNMEEKLVFKDDNDFSQEITTNLNQNFIDFGGELNLYGKLKKNRHLNIRAGWSKSNSEFKGLFDGNYDFNNFYTKVEYKKTINKISLNATARLSNVNITLNSKKSNKVFFEPLFGFSYYDYLFDFMEFNVKALISIENEFIHPIQLFNEEAFVDYRSIVSYEADFSKPKSSNIAFISTKISDNENTFLSANFELGFERTGNDFIPFITFEDDIVKTKYIQMKNTESIISIIGIDKYFSKIKSNMGFSFSNKLNKSFQSVDGVLSESNLTFNQMKLNVGIVATKKINISGSFAYNQILNKWLDTENNFSYLKYFFKWVYKINSNLKFSNDFQIVDFGDNFGGLNIVANLNLAHNLNNDKWSFAYSLSNIFNQDNINLSQSNLTFFSTSQYPLQSRFFLMTVTYKF